VGVLLFSSDARLDLHLPTEEAAFLAESVTFENPVAVAGDDWMDHASDPSRLESLRTV
jgi:hypothetical protein